MYKWGSVCAPLQSTELTLQLLTVNKAKCTMVTCKVVWKQHSDLFFNRKIYLMQWFLKGFTVVFITMWLQNQYTNVY